MLLVGGHRNGRQRMMTPKESATLQIPPCISKRTTASQNAGYLMVCFVLCDLIKKKERNSECVETWEQWNMIACKFVARGVQTYWNKTSKTAQKWRPWHQFKWKLFQTRLENFINAEQHYKLRYSMKSSLVKNVFALVCVIICWLRFSNSLLEKITAKQR